MMPKSADKYDNPWEKKIFTPFVKIPDTKAKKFLIGSFLEALGQKDVAADRVELFGIREASNPPEPRRTESNSAILTKTLAGTQLTDLFLAEIAQVEYTRPKTGKNKAGQDVSRYNMQHCNLLEQYVKTPAQVLPKFVQNDRKRRISSIPFYSDLKFMRQKSKQNESDQIFNAKDYEFDDMKVFEIEQLLEDAEITGELLKRKIAELIGVSAEVSEVNQALNRVI